MNLGHAVISVCSRWTKSAVQHHRQRHSKLVILIWKVVVDTHCLLWLAVHWDILLLISEISWILLLHSASLPRLQPQDTKMNCCLVQSHVPSFKFQGFTCHMLNISLQCAVKCLFPPVLRINNIIYIIYIPVYANAEYGIAIKGL